MFDHIFENRDKKVTNIIKLSDYLGRSLRENVEVFSIDDTDERVTFVTESGKIVAGSYDFEDNICLNDIQIEDGELFENTENFDEFVDYKISNFIHNIFEEDFAEADTSFNKVLQLWESRVKFTSVKKKLYEKSQKFNGTNRIVESEEFQRLVEVAPQLVVFLKENKNLINIPEINNMVKLSSSVSQAFDLPRLTVESLKGKTYTISEENNHTLYEMICKQELIRKELVESKNNFDLVWLNNLKISQLAGLIYEQDERVIAKSLVDAICEVPYLALATKRQITETLTNNLELNDTVKVNRKDIKNFSSLLFEYKKPLKRLFVSMLNEKYGISVQNLKDIPTFKSLLNTQVLIFESLAKLSPKGSVLKETLSEAAKMLKGKNGVESIDVNSFVELLFEKAEYLDILKDDALVDTIDIKETFSELDSIDELVNLILDRVQETRTSEKDLPEPSPKELKKKEKLDKNKAAAKEEEEEREVLRKQNEYMQNKTNKAAIKKQNSETDLGDEPQIEEDAEKGYPGIEGGTAEAEKEEKKRTKKKTRNDEEEYEEGEATAVEEPPEEEGEEKVPTSSEIMSSFKNFEDILNSIDFDEIVGGEGEEEADEEEAEKEAEVDKEEEGEE
jgi:small nuclear ribonucleoprotein (snRNP)-like protein